MKINFRILEKNDVEHSIVVRYFTDILTEEFLATSYDNAGNIIMDSKGYPLRCRSDFNYNIYDIDQPTESEIIEFIKERTPYDWLQMLEKSKDPNVVLSLSAVNPMLYTVNSYEFDKTLLMGPLSNTANNS